MDGFTTGFTIKSWNRLFSFDPAAEKYATGSLTRKNCLTLPAVCLLAKQKDLLTKTGFSGRSTPDQINMETEKLPPWSP
jgi:hypothetical protein